MSCPNKKNWHAECKPYLQVFSTKSQNILPYGSVTFEESGPICQFKKIGTNVIIAQEEGMYLFNYVVLTRLLPTESPVSAAYGLEINGVIPQQTRLGEGFDSFGVTSNVLFVPTGIIHLYPNDKIRLVNIGIDTTSLSNDLISVRANTASLTLEKISSH